jgi:hypothetical protein
MKWDNTFEAKELDGIGSSFWNHRDGLCSAFAHADATPFAKVIVDGHDRPDPKDRAIGTGAHAALAASAK